jgi:arginyl-tRNA--protein-N-Asp/Glu arginylyltransferase
MDTDFLVEIAREYQKTIMDYMQMLPRNPTLSGALLSLLPAIKSNDIDTLMSAIDEASRACMAAFDQITERSQANQESIAWYRLYQTRRHILTLPDGKAQDMALDEYERMYQEYYSEFGAA